MTVAFRAMLGAAGRDAGAGGGGGGITFVDSAQGTSPITLPAHQAGDLILVLAVEDSGSLPSLPTGWTSIRQTNISNVAARLAYRVATDGATPPGLWSPSTLVLAAVYRGASGVGQSTMSGVNSSSTVSIPALSTMDVTDGSSWVAGVIGRRGEAATEFTFTDLTNREFRDAGAYAGTGLICDTNAGVASWAGSETVSLSSALGFISGAVELLAA